MESEQQLSPAAAAALQTMKELGILETKIGSILILNPWMVDVTGGFGWYALLQLAAKGWFGFTTVQRITVTDSTQPFCAKSFQKVKPYLQRGAIFEFNGTVIRHGSLGDTHLLSASTVVQPTPWVLQLPSEIVTKIDRVNWSGLDDPGEYFLHILFERFQKRDSANG
jgi:hypothetical protein